MRIILILLIFLLALLLSITNADDQRGFVKIRDKAGNEVGLYENSYALLIGVFEYTNGWPSLSGVKKDIPKVKEALEKHGFTVTVVENPNYEQLKKAFEDFINKYGLKPDNRLLFYFSGHGHTEKLAYGGEMGYIVPSDAPNPNQDREGFFSKAVDMQLIEVYAKRIQAKHALFLFDSCFSGTIFDISKSVPENISYKTSKPVRQIITAGAADETVPDKSIFCEQLIVALNGEADSDKDSYITGMELGEFLQKTVVNYSKNAQHPQYGKIRDPLLDKGDFVFLLPGSAGSGKPFSITDLQGWVSRLSDMQKAFNVVKEFEKENVSCGLKIAAWQRFLDTYKEDDPYSQEDDAIKRDASKQLDHWIQIDRTEKAQKEWAIKLTEMQKAYNEIKESEAKNGNIDALITSWQKFIETYKDDNPYSQEDDTLR